MDYSRTRALLFFVLLCSSFAACIQFRTLTLYDGQTQPPTPVKPVSVDKVVASLLFEDDTTDIWGIVSDSCKRFALTQDVHYGGNTSLYLQWERQGCEWVGFGMGWDGYAGKNLEPLLPYAAFEMYVRTVKGKAFGLPFVFTLEDYSGVMSFCYTANKYFERTALDENWQKVVVPLSDFNDEGEGIDYTNIKQLQIEMQQSGEVYVDEIKLVMYEPEPQEVWLAEDERPDPTRLPQSLFDDDFANQGAWGLQTTDCLEVKRSAEQTYAGKMALHAQWDLRQSVCVHPYFGLSWSQWFPVDIGPMRERAVLQFYLKADQPEALTFRVELEDFNRNRASVAWNMDWASPATNGWYLVRIPMEAFFAEQNLIKGLSNASTGSTSASGPLIDPSQIKTLAFHLLEQGDMYLDQMSWEAL